jgi:hypothetical protein
MGACHECGGAGVIVNGHTEVCRVCKGAGSNGVDLSIDAGRGERIKPPCCARICNGIWCTLADGHKGDHANPDAEPVYGPLEARPEIWRKHKGKSE